MRRIISIFISYRRDDKAAAACAGRLYDRLTQQFGEEQIFMDIDTLKAGVDFVDVIEKTVERPDVLIAMIGNEWLDARDERGNRRLDNPEDWVRLEIATALKKEELLVVPTLVYGAAMPRSQDLPRPLKKLARRQAAEITHKNFHHDVDSLIEDLSAADVAEKEKREAEAAAKRGTQQAEGQRQAEEEQKTQRAVQAERQQERRKAEAGRLERDRREAQRAAKEEAEALRRDKERVKAKQLATGELEREASGSESPPERSQDAPDIVIDNQTGLMWTLEDNGDEDIDWNGANEYARNLELAGHSDWRLPTIRELEALYDSDSQEEIKIRKPFRLTGWWVWSSSRKGSDSVWSFHFYANRRSEFAPWISTLKRALCVRRSEE